MEINRSDIAKIIKMIKVNFENSYKLNSEEMELLIESWYLSLKNVPSDIVYTAASRVIQQAEFTPRLGNIVNEINKMLKALKKDEFTLWAELSKVLPEVENLAGRFAYTFVEKNGKTQGQNARICISEIYNSLDEDTKAYIHDETALIRLSKLPEEQLRFERTNFLKAIPKIRERMEIQNELKGSLPELANEDCLKLISDNH